MSSLTIHWFRQDLRLTDNSALTWAANEGRPIIPLYILDETKSRPLGSASRWWLHKSLESLKKDLKAQGLSLILRRGDPEIILREILNESGASLITWNRLYDGASIHRDQTIKSQFSVKSFNGSLLQEPWEVQTGSGGPYRVYTPFWRTFARQAPQIRKPTGRPDLIPYPTNLLSDDLNTWELCPAHPNWATGFEEAWEPGEAGAQKALSSFLNGPLQDYGQLRDRPDLDQTSRLSPHLHWGEISPQQIWDAVHKVSPLLGDNEITYLKELAWREFSYHLLYHFPELPEKSLSPSFQDFHWEYNENHLKSWEQGLTGVPLVDAGMRQLWHQGWMHNRVRMVVSSYLTKNLLLPWQWGEAWFWDTLLDADLASNGASWQWVAGSSPHSSPFYRIFNPITQSQKFDPEGRYIHQWVPELRGLKPPYLFDPSSVPAHVLQSSGIWLGQTYPLPLVDLKASRERALARMRL